MVSRKEDYKVLIIIDDLSAKANDRTTTNTEWISKITDIETLTCNSVCIEINTVKS